MAVSYLYQTSSRMKETYTSPQTNLTKQNNAIQKTLETLITQPVKKSETAKIVSEKKLIKPTPESCSSNGTDSSNKNDNVSDGD